MSNCDVVRLEAQPLGVSLKASRRNGWADQHGPRGTPDVPEP